MSGDKRTYSGIVLISMLFLGVGMVLGRGWLNDFQGFVASKVGGSGTTNTSQPGPPPSGFQGGSSGAPEAGLSGGGGSF